ncbi:AzlD domain-containing protein [Streptomyces sp. NBC_01571]|uniref:AzlD domain-containing protein n=1 Tax=Streptomyces sp. NBC_01571 TaxID=2975883 RepID=UPI00225BE2DC|nr:AzlD domain-containing protein [Streptomyces sp. NBC_01571]MCX4571691.1 AzlD domain-containing protein [Streptomyces sp. NBC_01571]
MPYHFAMLAALLALAAGTFAFRLVGPLLWARVALPPRAKDLLKTAAIVLLAALVATASLTTGHGAAGIARPAGVVVGGLLAARKAPFLLVVLAAAATTALLRLAHVN